MQQPKPVVVISAAQVRAIEDSADYETASALPGNSRLLSVTDDRRSGNLIFQEYRFGPWRESDHQSRGIESTAR